MSRFSMLFGGPWPFQARMRTPADAARWERMRAAALQRARPDAARDIARRLLELVP